jgi:polyisoprenoid-binding protein YceI
MGYINICFKQHLLKITPRILNASLSQIPRVIINLTKKKWMNLSNGPELRFESNRIHIPSQL